MGGETKWKAQTYMSSVRRASAGGLLLTRLPAPPQYRALQGREMTPRQGMFIDYSTATSRLPAFIHSSHTHNLRKRVTLWEILDSVAVLRRGSEVRVALCLCMS